MRLVGMQLGFVEAAKEIGESLIASADEDPRAFVGRVEGLEKFLLAVRMVILQKMKFRELTRFS
jgi:hypothetical protein